MATPQINDIQGDIVLGLPKRHEQFYLFEIRDVNEFKRRLKVVIPYITTVEDVMNMFTFLKVFNKSGSDGLASLTGTNIAFTFNGLVKLNVTDDIGDPEFKAGQLAQAEALGDPGVMKDGKFEPTNWSSDFKSSRLHGVIFFAGGCQTSVETTAADIITILNGPLRFLRRITGDVRPPPNKGREMFGFMDGISLPCISSITSPMPGQQVIDPGILIVGEKGDKIVAKRPSWAKNGSFMVLRVLLQHVPEFNKFVKNNPLVLPGLDRKQGSELFAARLVGRWKSGAPLDLAPLRDDKKLADDPLKNNSFDYSKDPRDSTRCPFSAHIRKTNPRSDLPPPAVLDHAIFRAGIPFGPEVTSDENRRQRTKHSRGLIFVCYQSSLANGFEFMQKAWANNINFPPKKGPDGKPVVVGFDPIIGQNGGKPRSVGGLNPDAQNTFHNFPADFVLAKGGAYFFVPSISALNVKFTAIPVP